MDATSEPVRKDENKAKKKTYGKNSRNIHNKPKSLQTNTSGGNALFRTENLLPVGENIPIQRDKQDEGVNIWEQLNDHELSFMDIEELQDMDPDESHVEDLEAIISGIYCPQVSNQPEKYRFADCNRMRVSGGV